MNYLFTSLRMGVAAIGLSLLFSCAAEMPYYSNDPIYIDYKTHTENYKKHTLNTFGEDATSYANSYVLNLDRIATYWGTDAFNTGIDIYQSLNADNNLQSVIVRRYPTIAGGGVNYAEGAIVMDGSSLCPTYCTVLDAATTQRRSSSAFRHVDVETTLPGLAKYVDANRKVWDKMVHMVKIPGGVLRRIVNIPECKYIRVHNAMRNGIFFAYVVGYDANGNMLSLHDNPIMYIESSNICPTYCTNTLYTDAIGDNR